MARQHGAASGSPYFITSTCTYWGRSVLYGTSVPVSTAARYGGASTVWCILYGKYGSRYETAVWYRETVRYEGVSTVRADSTVRHYGTRGVSTARQHGVVNRTEHCMQQTLARIEPIFSRKEWSEQRNGRTNHSVHI